MSDVRIGILSHCYVNNATYATPTWLDADLISDLAVNPKWNEGESTVRRTVLQTFEPTSLALELPGKIRTDRTDAVFEILEAAFLNKTVLDILALNGKKDQNNSMGFRFDGRIFDWSEDQALGNVLFKSFTIKPCASSNIPKVALVQGGVLVFDDFGAVPGS